VNVSLDPADFLPVAQVPVLLRGQFSDSVCASWSSCCQAKFPLFFSAHIFSSCLGPSCASVFIPAPPVRYFSASILLPPISPGLTRVCTILFLSRLSSPAQSLLRLRFQWAPAGPSGAQSSRQERVPASSLSVQDRQACLTNASMFLALRF
jgi:hypothetical protein